MVTDSTAYLPAELVAEHGLRVVPLQVMVDGRTYEEGPALPGARVAEALRRRDRVTTSRPTPAQFAAAYADAARSGATGVVSVHLSAQMSGTHGSAVLAAREAPVPVRVVDSESMGMALGLAAVAAARRAGAGADLDEVARSAAAQAVATSAFFCVDTLEHLRRSGRIGAAATLLGSALAVKPLLHLVNGQVEPLEKVRTTSRAMARLVELAAERATPGCDLVVHHLDAVDRADALADALGQRVPLHRSLRVVEVGAVVGAHVGPGMLGVVVAPHAWGATTV